MVKNWSNSYNFYLFSGLLVSHTVDPYRDRAKMSEGSDACDPLGHCWKRGSGTHDQTIHTATWKKNIRGVQPLGLSELTPFWANLGRLAQNGGEHFWTSRPGPGTLLKNKVAVYMVEPSIAWPCKNVRVSDANGIIRFHPRFSVLFRPNTTGLVGIINTGIVPNHDSGNKFRESRCGHKQILENPGWAEIC